MYATDWQEYPSDEQIEKHNGPWLLKIEGYPKSLSVGWFEKVLDGKEWAWCNDNMVLLRADSAKYKLYPFVESNSTVQAKCGRVRLPTLIPTLDEKRIQTVWVREADIHRVFDYTTAIRQSVVTVKTDGDVAGTYTVDASADDVIEACAIAYNAYRANNK